MAEEKFAIGEKEQHIVSVSWNPASKHMKVGFDGQTVFNKGFALSPSKQKFHFDVGTSETHKVEVSAGPFSPIEVLVDGKPVQPML